MNNKTVLITGASHGIGNAIEKKFAEEKYNVVLNYFSSQENAMKTLSEIRENCANAVAIKADVSKSDEVNAMMHEIESVYGGVDILINNAGISQFSLLSDVSEEEWDRVFAVNMKSAFLCSKAVISHMVREKWGKIINISSIWGIEGASCEVCYSASKAALIGFTKALAKELAPSNINVNCIAPGMVDTKMNANFTEAELVQITEEIPLGRKATSQEIAQNVSFIAS